MHTNETNNTNNSLVPNSYYSFHWYYLYALVYLRDRCFKNHPLRHLLHRFRFPVPFHIYRNPSPR